MSNGIKIKEKKSRKKHSFIFRILFTKIKDYKLLKAKEKKKRLINNYIPEEIQPLPQIERVDGLRPLNANQLKHRHHILQKIAS